MKNAWTTLIFFLFMMVSVYGNSIAFKTISVKCTDNLNQFCLYGYTNEYIDIDKVKADFVAYKNTKVPLSFASVVYGTLKEKTDDITKQKDHLEAIMKQKRAQYQLYKTTVLGQLTSPTNVDLNYHQVQFQRFEGWGIRLRF